MSPEAPATLRSSQSSIKFLFGFAGLTAAIANAYQPEIQTIRTAVIEEVVSFVTAHPSKSADMVPPAVK